MGNQHLGVFLHGSGHVHHGHTPFTNLHHLQVARPHDAVGLACRHQLDHIDLGASHFDADIQARFFVKPCGQGLVKTTMLGLGKPIGHVDKFFIGTGCGAQECATKSQSRAKRCTHAQGLQWFDHSNAPKNKKEMH